MLAFVADVIVDLLLRTDSSDSHVIYSFEGEVHQWIGIYERGTHETLTNFIIIGSRSFRCQ